MAQSKKTNLFEMGANFDSGWQEISESKRSSKLSKSQDEHTLVVQFEKRRGKPVTLVGPFSYDESELKKLHKKIKKTLACGGTIEQQWLIFQGDHRDTVKPLFVKYGWSFK